MPVPQQALVLINDDNMIFCWHNGGGFRYTKPHKGTNIEVTIENNNVSITTIDNGNFTATAFVF